MRGMGAGSPGCRVPGARAALEAAGSARPSGTRLCLSDGATGWTGSGPEHSRLPCSPGPLGLAPLAALPVLHLSSSDQALPPLLHPPLWGVSWGPLRPSRPWGRGGGTGTRGNMRTGLELSFCFPLGAPRVPLHPPPQAPDLPPQAPQAALPALVPGVPTACSSFPAAWRPPSPGSQGAAPLLSTGLSSLLSFLSFPQVQGSATPQLRGSSPCPAHLAYCCWPQLWPGGGGQGEGLVARSTTVGGTPPWLGLAPSAYSLLR